MSQSENTADPADRFLIRSALTGIGDGNSLQNLNTTKLPDGATAYVVADKSIWVLDKASTATPVTNEIIAPGSGPGRWLRFGTAGAGAGPAQMSSSAFNTFPVDGNWGTSTSANFALDAVSDESVWALTALGGILTYTGPTRRFLVNVVASVRVANVGAARDVFLGISFNNDLTGGPSPGGGEVDSVIAVADADVAMSTARLVTLATGQGLRAKMAAVAGAVTLSAMIRMVVTPAD